MLLRRLITKILDMRIGNSWPYVVVFAVFHFFSSWAAMQYFEPSAEYVRADTFYWFYVVSTTTIGYGDFYPSTTGARLVAALYMFPFGLILAGYIIGIVANAFSNYTTKRITGMLQLKLDNHIIIFGEDDERSRRMVKNMLLDSEQDVCLVSEHKENPLAGTSLHFVSGNIMSSETRKRACIEKASVVVICGQNDNQTIGEALTALDETNPDCRIILYFQHRESAERFDTHSDGRVVCVSSVDVDVVVQEALDSGSSDYISALVDNDKKGTFMRMELPKDMYTMTYIDLAKFLINEHIVPLGLYDTNGVVSMLPEPEDIVYGGDAIAVVSGSRANIEKACVKLRDYV